MTSSPATPAFPTYGDGVASLLGRLGPEAALDVGALGPYLASIQAITRGETPSLRRLPAVNGIAVVGIEGPLSRYAWAYREFVILDGYDRIAEQVRAAIAEHARGAVDLLMLRIDSPGGVTTGGFETIRQLRAELDASGLPVLAVADERAASMGYAFAAGLGDEILVLPEGAVGSVGTIATHYDISRALANAGVTVTHFVDPDGKSLGWPERPLDDEARARMQERVSEVSSTFYDLVARRRGTTPEAVKDLDARMFSGAKAVAAGLADGVASWPQVISRAEEMARTKKENRRMAKAVNALLGLPDTASAEDIERAAEAKRPILDLGTFALELMGAPSAEGAKGKLVAWQRSAEEAAQLRAKAAQDETARAEVERASLYVEIAKAMGPGTVWQGGEKANGPQSWLASMSLEALRGCLAALPKTPALRPVEGTKVSSPEPTDDEVKAYAKKNGIKNPAIAKQALKNAMAEGTA